MRSEVGTDAEEARELRAVVLDGREQPRHDLVIASLLFGRSHRTVAVVDEQVTDLGLRDDVDGSDSQSRDWRCDSGPWLPARGANADTEAEDSFRPSEEYVSMTDDDTAESPDVPVVCPECGSTSHVPLSEAAATIEQHNERLHDGAETAQVDPDVAEHLADMIAEDLDLL